MMDKQQLIEIIDQAYKATMITLRSFQVGGQNNQEIIITENQTSLQAAIDGGEVSDFFRKALSDAIAEKVIEHITNTAETEGAANEIIKLKQNVEVLNNILLNLCTLLSGWVPVPMDGGASLKILLASSLSNYMQQLSQNLQELETGFIYEIMNKNIK